MSDFVKQPLFIYDEPAVYRRFDGGINNDPANENLNDNQIRDAVNIHYNNGVLERREGANRYKNLIYHELDASQRRNIVQGAFTFVGRFNPSLVVVKDGHLYYSVLAENDTFDLIEIPIIVPSFFVNSQKVLTELRNPENYLIGLKTDVMLGVTSEDNYELKNHDGFIDTDTEYNYGTLVEENEETYYTSGLFGDGTPRLILQNYKPVQGAVKDDTLYIATGTRFIRIYETVFTQNDKEQIVAIAEVVEPYRTTAWDYLNIGANYLSPFPELNIFSSNELGFTRIAGIKTLNHTFFRAETSTPFEAIMDFEIGYDENNYYFKWEYNNGDAWVTAQNWTLGANEFNIPHTFTSSDTTVTVRASFADRFVNKSLPVAEWEIDVANGETGAFIQAYAIEPGEATDYLPEPSRQFIDIHGCNKLFVDGNKIILYGSKINSGSWYKTIISNYAYITDRNSLNFQTSKNERIVFVVPLENFIVVFADNPNLGGSIHKVFGNGDDFDNSDGFFNPYRRTIVNVSHSCDHPGSVQFVDNYIIFKYRQSIYSIDTRDLNNDRLQVTLLSRNIGHESATVFIPEVPFAPDYETKLFSEVTEDYYGLIFPEFNLRWKMYYKRAIPDENVVYFPWVRDISQAFNIDSIIKINNISTHILDDMLVQYNSRDFLDIEEPYEHTIITKAYDLGYPGFGKFVNSLMVSFFRSAKANSIIDVFGYNEANYKLIGKPTTAFYDEETKKIIYGNEEDYYETNVPNIDQPSTIPNNTSLGNSRLGSDLYTTRVYNPDLKFPCLSTYIIITSSSPEAFALAGMTFDYTSTELPAKTLPQIYSEIFRKDDE
jgi:hypothetical protein